MHELCALAGASRTWFPTRRRLPVRPGERCRLLPRMNQPAKATTVTIIGAGLGGIALVANLGLRGYRLRLHDRDDARIARVRERGGLDVEGLANGFAPLELVTPQLTPAVDGADVIVVVTGSHFHADVARGLAGVLRDGQSILLIQGCTGGSLLPRRELLPAGRP